MNTPGDLPPCTSEVKNLLYYVKSLNEFEACDGNGNWIVLDLRGPAGPAGTGVAGPAGATGPAGTSGTAGTNGINGGGTAAPIMVRDGNGVLLGTLSDYLNPYTFDAGFNLYIENTATVTAFATDYLGNLISPSAEPNYFFANSDCTGAASLQLANPAVANLAFKTATYGLVKLTSLTKPTVRSTGQPGSCAILAASLDNAPNAPWLNATAMKMVGGILYAAYADGNNHLKFATCAANCGVASSWSSVVVDSSSSVSGAGISMLVSSGVVSIAYATGPLKFATCSSGCTTASNWTTLTLETPDPRWFDSTPSIVQSSGVLYVAYVDGPTMNPKIATCAASCGTLVNWSLGTIESSSGLGIVSVTLTNNDGILTAMYHAQNGPSGLHVATCTTSCTETANWTSAGIDANAERTQMPYSLISSGGVLYATYARSSNSNWYLVYATCSTTCTTAGNWTSVNLDGAYSSNSANWSQSVLQIDSDGSLNVAYFNPSSAGGYLKFARCASGCTTADNWTKFTLDNTSNNTGNAPALVTTNGANYVMYADDVNSTVRYFSCGSGCASLSSWAANSVTFQNTYSFTTTSAVQNTYPTPLTVGP